MKLTPIFTGLLYVAKSQQSKDHHFETIINEALSKIYSPTEAGFEIMIEPYISGEIKYKNLEEIGFYGTLGKVDFQAVYNKQKCDATIKSGTDKYPGIVNNLPGYNHIFPKFMWDYTFENTHTLELPCFGEDNFDNFEIKYSTDGKINGEKFDTRLSLSLDEFVVTSKKYQGTVVFKGSSEFSDNFPKEIKPEIPSSFNVEVTPSVKVDCVNLFSDKCSAEMVVTRVVNENELPSHNFSWKGKSGVFTIQQDQKVVFKLKINYGKYWKVTYLCTKEICGNFAEGYYTSNKMVHLITVPSDEAIPDITEAIAQFSEIYMRIYGELKSSTRNNNYERVGQFAVYFDQFATVLTEEKDAFDCSKMVEATGFEWPALANYWQVKSVQSYGKQVCASFNDNSEMYLMETVAPKVEEGRAFLRKVLSGEAESSFMEWTLDLVV